MVSIPQARNLASSPASEKRATPTMRRRRTPQIDEADEVVVAAGAVQLGEDFVEEGGELPCRTGCQPVRHVGRVGNPSYKRRRRANLRRRADVFPQKQVWRLLDAQAA